MVNSFYFIECRKVEKYLESKGNTKTRIHELTFSRELDLYNQVLTNFLGKLACKR